MLLVCFVFFPFNLIYSFVDFTHEKKLILCFKDHEFLMDMRALTHLYMMSVRRSFAQ